MAICALGGVGSASTCDGNNVAVRVIGLTFEHGCPPSHRVLKDRLLIISTLSCIARMQEAFHQERQATFTCDFKGGILSFPLAGVVVGPE